MSEQVLQYQTTLPVEQCIQQIITKPWIYGPDPLNELWYKCDEISDSSLLVTFTGGCFRKITRTQYIVDFSKQEDGTHIAMTFKKEMLGLPPMTLVRDIDCFMETKISASRKSHRGIFLE